MKHLLWLFAWPFCSFSAAAQAPPLAATSVKAAALGSLIYPGFKLGLERPYKIIQVEKTRKNGSKTISKERSLTFNLGFYHHAAFHDNLYFLLERQKRRQSPSGWFAEVAPGVGWSRTFLGGPTYTVSDAGEVTKKSAAGYGYAMLSAAFGGGYNLAVKNQKPVRIYGKLSLFALFPYNSFLYLRPTVELGVTRSLGSFWTAKPKIKLRKK